MPVAPISADVHLFYEDTGAPNGSAIYTTLVLVHGVIFHGGALSFLRISKLSPRTLILVT